MPRRPTGIPKAHECRNSLTDLGGQDERIGPLGLLNDQVDGQLYVAIQWPVRQRRLFRPAGIPKAHECRNSFTDLRSKDGLVSPLASLKRMNAASHSLTCVARMSASAHLACWTARSTASSMLPVRRARLRSPSPDPSASSNLNREKNTVYKLLLHCYCSCCFSKS